MGDFLHFNGYAVSGFCSVPTALSRGARAGLTRRAEPGNLARFPVRQTLRQGRIIEHAVRRDADLHEGHHSATRR